MKVIALTRKGLFAKVSDEDYEYIANYGKWRPHPGKNGVYYAICSKGKANILMHVLIMGRRGVDHKDRDGLNNQRENLRFFKDGENMYNSKLHLTNKTGYRGVHLRTNRGTYNAKIGKTMLGSFNTPEEAARAYDLAAKEQVGEFATLNFPNQ